MSNIKIDLVWDTRQLLSNKICPQHLTRPPPGSPKKLNPHLDKSFRKGPSRMM